MSTTFVQVLQSLSRREFPISEARLTHLRRVIRHVDHREARIEAFALGRTARMIARWSPGGVFKRDPECEVALEDLEVMLSMLASTDAPAPSAREVFQAMPRWKRQCQARYFDITCTERGDLVLTFRDPVALARLNDYIATHWARIMSP